MSKAMISYKFWIVVVGIIVCISTIANTIILKAELQDGALGQMIEQTIIKEVDKVYLMMIEERVMRANKALDRFPTPESLGDSSQNIVSIELACITPEVYKIVLYNHSQLPEFCNYLGLFPYEERKGF